MSSGRPLRFMVAALCCPLRPARLRFAARRAPGRGRPRPCALFARRPPAARLAALARPSALRPLGSASPRRALLCPRYLGGPGLVGLRWGPGVAPPFGASCFDCALLPPFSAPGPHLRHFAANRRLSWPECDCHPVLRSRRDTSHLSAVLTLAAAGTLHHCLCGETAQGYRAASVRLRSVRFQLRY